MFPKHLRMGTAKMKLDGETEEEGKKRGVSVERSKDGTKKKESRRHIIYCQNALFIASKILTLEKNMFYSHRNRTNVK